MINVIYAIIVILVRICCQAKNGYNVSEWRCCCLKEKKTEVITIRVPPKTRRAIEQEAESREWTPSKMAEKILSAWAEEHSPQQDS
jgi:hypothetical protein